MDGVSPLGALKDDSPLYVEREADHGALKLLQQGEYIKLLEPRQQGKTSLIYRLRRELLKDGVIVAVVNVEDLTENSQAQWFGELSRRILRQIPEAMRPPTPVLPTELAGWRSFLEQLIETEHSQPLRRMVIAIDETGSIPREWSSKFCSSVRALHDSRNIHEEFERLTFLFAGAVHPDDLITDRAISPFNVAHHVPIEDFSREQVRSLAERRAAPKDQLEAIADQLYYWTDGQPYLTQRIYDYMRDSFAATHAAVAACVARFISEDTIHLPRVARMLEEDHNLYASLRNLIDTGMSFQPAVSMHHYRLAHIVGVVKLRSGRCVIRNRIYAQALRHLILPPTSDAGAPEALPLELDELRRWVISPQPLLPIPNEDLRIKLFQGYSAGELRMLCFDHFQDVYRQLADGMSTDQMLLKLLDYCEGRSGERQRLIRLLQQQRPHLFQ